METRHLIPNFFLSVVLNVFLYLEMVVWERASESIDALKGARNSEFSCCYQNVLQNLLMMKIMGSEQLQNLNTVKGVCVCVWFLEQTPSSL